MAAVEGMNKTQWYGGRILDPEYYRRLYAFLKNSFKTL